MSTEKTVWHPPFTMLITERGPRWVKVSGEHRVATELRLDDLLEVLADVQRDPNDRGDVLRGMWGFLVWVGLLEFKSISRPFRRGDLFRLLAYGFAWLASHQHPKGLRVGAKDTRAARCDDVTLFLAVPTMSPPLVEEIDELGFSLEPGDGGYRPVSGSPLRLVVVDLSRAGALERDELMQWFAGVVESLSLDTRRWLTQHTGGKGAMNATPDLEGWDDWMSQYIASVPPEKLLARLKPEDRLAGLKPEDRLAGLKPEDRLAGLDAAQAVLALPVEVLRALPESFLATLPDDVQATVRARLAR